MTTKSTDLAVVRILQQEIASTPPRVNGAINQLVQGFIKYLKEPRYQSPLTLKELSVLFGNFYHDLNSTVLTIYTQSNSIKKQLISNCQYFKDNPKTFDYLLSIANYSSSSIKLVKRTDPQALLQLRIFNLYKFLVVFNVIEQGQILLFQSINNKDDDISLYDKIFRFDEKDMIIQEHLDRKLAALASLKLPFDKFIENNHNSQLISFLQSEPPKELEDLFDSFRNINTVITPFSKLKVIVHFQKRLISILSEHCDLQPHHINNDTLLPVLIYLVIYKLPKHLDLFLNFEFIKNFVNLIDPYHVDIISNTSFYFYNPSETSRTKNIQRSTTIYDCINLNDSDTAAGETGEEAASDVDFFKTDKEIIQFLNSNYLNNSELSYYLTNFEAVLFFIQNVTIDELTDLKVEDELLNKPISTLVEKELASRYQFPPTKPETSIEERKDSVDANRSRSSSLFNTLTTKINEATKNRSRSNSGLLKNTRESFPSVNNGENDDESFIEGPVNSNNTATIDNSMTFNMMKSVLGRFGSVSMSQLKGTEEEEGLVNEPKHVRSGSIIDKLSPNSTRTRSSSFENSYFPSNLSSSTSNNSNNRNLSVGSNLGTNALSPRKNTIASKLSSGVSEIMTKFNNPASSPINNQSVNNSEASLKSANESGGMSDKFNDNSTIIQKKPDYSRSRTASIQIMEKWFTNISNNTHTTHEGHIHKNNSNDSVSMSHEGSVFSTPSKELTKFQNVDFDSLTVMDLRLLKTYYDQLCSELNINKFESKSTNEEMAHEEMAHNELPNDEELAPEVLAPTKLGPEALDPQEALAEISTEVQNEFKEPQINVETSSPSI